eukprot:CAMPEP_0194034784 /NCGR_PEP_ID=MMETSP0009_2-20130614/7212_1 /TAXON_ID=210454 /ORGANISM="Grammatophora oceanica, Strain CCMP 410" /LENGTH=232 /DNA_ID=CAMNT_0038675845 /DNA_START=84 /DNA_END=785 /DNA_ORIENTATION=+
MMNLNLFTLLTTTALALLAVSSTLRTSGSSSLFVSGFSIVGRPAHPQTKTSTTTRLHFGEDDETATSDDGILSVLETSYPTFYNSILKKNNALWNTLTSSSQMTLFCPSEEAWNNANTKKRLEQLQDPRNLEVTEKVASYHAIAGEIVTADQLFNSGGIITVGGEVPVDRTVKGGLFGVGGTEDGGVTVNGAKVVKSFLTQDEKAMIHEVDALINPNILWRYVDQLRIPGSS